VVITTYHSGRSGVSEPHPGNQPEDPQFRKEGPADAASPPPSYPPAGQGAGAPQQGYPPAGQQGYPPAPTGQPGVGQELSPTDQRMWAMLGHLGGILFGFLAPLVVYLVQKDRGQYVKEQSAEALNFQITLLIGYVVSFILTFLIIGIFTWIAVGIAGLVFAIIAGLAANKGENYRYPVNIRMIT